MNKYVVVYNSHEILSRDFVAELDPSIEKIDWYSVADEQKVVEYISKEMPGICMFPSLVDTESKKIVMTPQNYDAGVALLEAMIEDEIGRQIATLKTRRNGLLAACDWVMLSDSQASPGCRAAFEAYRQILRDLDFSVPTAVVFPEQPGYEKVSE